MNLAVTLVFTFNAIIQGRTNSTTEKPAREHKIHNIVLYPDKHSWCTKTAIVQVVGHPGCNAAKVDNNVCVGGCFSYIVPRIIPETPGDVLPYCDSCQPGHVSWKKVSLECTGMQNQSQIHTLIKYVEFIHDCNCAACHVQKNPEVLLQDNDDGGENLSDNLVDDLPVALTTETSDSTQNSTVEGFKTMISGVLKTLNNEDEKIIENNDSEVKGLHRNVWKRLLEKVETTNGSLDSNVFNQLVKTVEDEMKIKFNYKRLKQALLTLKKYEAITKINSKTNSFDQNNSTINSTDIFVSGKYSKLPVNGTEHMTTSPVPDTTHYLLKPAISGSEIIFHHNMVANDTLNHIAPTSIKAENQTTSVGVQQLQ